MEPKCKNCKFWKEAKIGPKDDSNKVCEKLSEGSLFEVNTKPEFGCILFEEKE